MFSPQIVTCHQNCAKSNDLHQNLAQGQGTGPTDCGVELDLLLWICIFFHPMVWCLFFDLDLGGGGLHFTECNSSVRMYVLLKKYYTDLHQTRWRGGIWQKSELCFWIIQRSSEIR